MKKTDISLFFLIVIIFSHCKNKDRSTTVVEKPSVQSIDTNEKLDEYSENIEKINELAIHKEQEKYKTIVEKYKSTFEKYYGYYINANDLNNVVIIKVFFTDHLIFQEMHITDDALLINKTLILDKAEEYRDNNFFNVTFRNREDYFAAYFDITRGENLRETMLVGYGSGRENLVFDESNFIQSPEEVINTFHSFFSYDSQKKYTGEFVFQRYEIETYNIEYPTEEEILENKCDMIVVEFDGKGFLYATKIINDNAINMGKFFITNTKKTITSSIGEATFKGHESRYYYENENTIFYTWNVWHSSDIEDDPGSSITYKLIYKRKNMS